MFGKPFDYIVSHLQPTGEHPFDVGAFSGCLYLASQRLASPWLIVFRTSVFRTVAEYCGYEVHFSPKERGAL